MATRRRDEEATTAAEHWWRPPSTTSTPTALAASPPTSGPACPRPATGGGGSAVGNLGSADPHGTADPSPTTRSPYGAPEDHNTIARAAVTTAATDTVCHLRIAMTQRNPNREEHAGQAPQP
ncbi:hypothetical protein GCM10009613_26760 [Pseudonocardia kongjuensis]|uniref:Uncharacterized protein n=1 Tax=Pseudonocardia kongjuensis TaxID=102227 RepID=A0ABN1XSS9_9PSEU